MFSFLYPSPLFSSLKTAARSCYSRREVTHCFFIHVGFEGSGNAIESGTGGKVELVFIISPMFLCMGVEDNGTGIFLYFY